eukprot:TRINITY_DN2292_c0_g1_i1.p1 TRINITY_DN2292_c0_g1~~TRINITY_DN2292_c0_g1_i1.p1  ORF type:complete len:991 (-),score=229.83 TRINITY_DN2292_c0_g1_i1:14-2773(-)
MTCWGDNNYEQLGLGTALRQYSPPSTTIALGSVPVHSVFGGASHICALLVDGDVKCWGKNGAGELGIGSKINVGDQPGEMPPVSAILAPILMSVPPVVYVPLQRLTLVGSGFGNSAENVTVNFESSNSSISANCPLVFLALFRLECIPPAFTDGIPFQLVFVGRKGFGTSNALGPVRILPSDPVLVSMAPTSGEFGTLLSISVFGISGANETTVGFVPASAGAVCSPGKCNGTVRAVDFDAQTAIVEVPDLPAVGAYFVVVRTPRGVSQSNVTFTFCSENCAECTAPRSSTEVECTLCRIGWSFNISGSTCIKYCGSGEFSDRSNSSYRCRKCDTSCAECQGPESDQCTVCHTGIVVESVSERGIKCGTACKEGFFFNNGTCYCPPGSFYLAEQKNCERCPPNSFSEYRVDQNGPSSHSCTACPLDRTTRGYDGQTSPSACLCKSDTYPSFGGAKCIACTSLSGRVRCNGQQSVNGTTVASAGLEVAAGYWLTTDAKYLRNPDSSEHWFVVVQCPVRGACTGGSEEASCADGYTGPACGLCARGYGRLGEQCAKCPNQSVSGFLVFFIPVLVCVACAGVVHFFTRAKKDDDSASEGSAMQRLKIAITHFQILGFIGGFASDWPETLVKVFAIPTAVATLSSGTDNIAIDCAMHPSLYDRAIVLFLLPLILASGVAAGFWLLRFVKPETDLRSKIAQGTLALLYVAHPGIFQGLMQLLVCIPVGRQSLAKSDMSVSCEDPSFVALQVFAGLYIVMYGFGGLLAVFMLIKRDRERFPFLTNAFVEERYYWDLVVTVRKMLFVLLSLFAYGSLQLFFGNWILLASWMAQSHFKPYKSKMLEKIETASTWVLLVTVTTGILFFTGTLENSRSDSNTAGIVVSALLMILNFAAIVTFAGSALHRFFRKSTEKRVMEVMLLDAEN